MRRRDPDGLRAASGQGFWRCPTVTHLVHQMFVDVMGLDRARPDRAKESHFGDMTPTLTTEWFWGALLSALKKSARGVASSRMAQVYARSAMLPITRCRSGGAFRVRAGPRRREPRV